MAFPVVELCVSLINSLRGIWENWGGGIKFCYKWLYKETSYKQASKTSVNKRQWISRKMERHRGNSVKCLGFIASKKNHNLKEWKNTPTDGCLSPDQTDRLSLFLSDKQLWPEPWELNLLHQKAQKAIVFLTVQLIKKKNKNPCLKANTMFPLLMLYSSADRKGRVCIPVSQCTFDLGQVLFFQAAIGNWGPVRISRDCTDTGFKLLFQLIFLVITV